MIKNVWKSVIGFSFGLMFALTTFGNTAQASVEKADFNQVNIQNVVKSGKGLFGTQLDKNKRPSMSHIILKDSDEVGRRIGNPSIPSNMSRWVPNRKINDPVKGEQFLWNRGHGIGNQFGGGVTNVGENIAAETVYLNQVLMLHYEGSTNTPNTLDNWLHNNPEKYLDYVVVFNYQAAGDQIPVSVTLAYRGLDKTGKPEFISNIPNDTREGSGKQAQTSYGYTVVTLKNIEPGTKFSYVTGEILRKGVKEHDGWDEKALDMTQVFGQFKNPSDANSNISNPNQNQQESTTGNWLESLGSMKVLIFVGVGIVILGLWLMDEYK